MFVKVSKRMAELVQDNTSILILDLRIVGNPPKVHSGLMKRNTFAVASDKGPRTFRFLECNTNCRVPSRNELELDVDVGFPFLDDLLHFVLLGLRPEGLDEAVSDGLLEVHNQDPRVEIKDCATFPLSHMRSAFVRMARRCPRRVF